MGIFFLLALGVRMMAFPSVFTDEGVRLFADDPPYHVHRVAMLLEDPPAPSDPDPLIAHPGGAVAHWPWGFDWLLAAAAAPFTSSPPDHERVAGVCSIIAPILGAVLAPLVLLLSMIVSTRRVALASTALCSFLAAHVAYSMVGRVDHHVLEPIAVTLIAIGPLRRLAGISDRGPGVSLSGLVAGLSLAFIPAAMPLILLSFAVLGTSLVPVGDRSAVRFAGFALTGAVVSLAASPHPFEWVFYSPSLIHITLVAIAVAVIVTASLITRLGSNSPVAGPVAAGLAVAAIAGAAMAIFVPGFHHALEKGFSYIVVHDVSALSLEAKPLISDLGRAGDLLSWLAPLSLLGAISMIFPSKTKGLKSARRTAALFGLALFALALAQRRFLVAATPFYVLCLAEGLSFTWTIIHGARTGGAAMGLLKTIVFVAIMISGLAPMALYLVDVEPISARDRAMYKAAVLVAASTNETGRFGVLAPWSYGHLFQFKAGRPTVCDNFFGVPENDRALLRCLEILYETNGETAIHMLRENLVDTVVLSPPHPEEVRIKAELLGLDPDRFVSPDGRFTTEFANTFWARLGLWAQQASTGDSGPFGMVLLDRVLEKEAPGGVVMAEVLIFGLK